MSDTIQQQFQEEIENGEVMEMETEIRSPVAAKYNLPNAVIAEMKQRFLVLTIQGVNDKAGYLAIQEAERKTRETRLNVEKTRKGLKEGLLAEGRIIDGEAKRLTAELEPIEAHLKNQMKSIDAEKERAKAEAQRILDERNQGRMNALIEAGKTDIRLAEVVNMSDAVFADYLKMAISAQAQARQAVIDAETARKAKEEAEALEVARKAKEERDRLAAVQAENAREAARLAALKAEQDKRDAEFRAERESFEKQKAESERAAREERIRKEAEAKAKADAEVAAQNAEKEKAAKSAKLKAIEEAKPDAAKLEKFATEMSELVFPKMVSEAGKIAEARIQEAQDIFVEAIRAQAKALTK
jgi:hypothetical protein